MKIPKDLRWEPTGQTIGAGGQGQVDLVKDKNGEFAGIWALKTLKHDASRQAYERFSLEIDAIKKLDHPNIIKSIDDSAPADNFQYYVMEYIEGARPLAKLLGSNDNPFYANPVKSVSLFEQICLAICACEENSPQILHRDLSPSNILVAPE
jgi:serine/threonine protein kinase